MPLDGIILRIFILEGSEFMSDLTKIETCEATISQATMFFFRTYNYLGVYYFEEKHRKQNT
ncbi:hypothetical protein LSPH24S_06150 [Lysinibacillus sphaericus]